MDQHSINVLEFIAIIKRVGSYAISKPGRDMCFNISPKSDRGWIERSLFEISQMREAIGIYGSIPLFGLKDITVILLRTKQSGSILNIEDFLAIRGYLDVLNNTIKWLSKGYKAYETLRLYKERIVPLNELNENLERCFEPNGEIKNNATPALAKIRKQLKHKKKEIIDLLESFVKERANQEVLQGDFITIRNDRYVVPIKTQKKTALDGIVHDESDSGATLFIEPIVSVEPQNDYRRLRIKEDEEIKKILFDLTEKVSAVLGDIETNLDTLIHLDFLQAKSIFCETIGGISPIISDKPVIKLKGAKHPLLIYRYMNSPEIGKEPSAINIELNENCKAIVLSGPNSGGKTVTLKMIGILQLMIQAGLQIPVMDGSELGIFEEVLADIGDEQDIAMDLSSFTSHMKNMVRILYLIKPNCICLLDELGSDTDPAEGAALGVAILEYILEKGALCLLTTHHNGIKAYASMHPESIQNASMGFDPTNMQPTYQLHIGYPGSSNALDICSRLGIPNRIIERAQNVLGAGEIELGALLKRLNQQEIKLREEFAKQEVFNKKIELMKKRYENLKEIIEKRQAKIEKEAQSRIRILVDKGRKEIERVIKELKASDITVNAAKAAQKEINGIVKGILPRSIRKPPPIIALDINNIRAGQEVFVHTINKQGIVDEINFKEKKIWVTIGSLRFQVGPKDLGLLKASTSHEPYLQKIIIKAPDTQKEKVSPKIIVVGKRVEDAITEIDKYIDDAILAHLSQISIIHGIGTRVLQRGIETFLLDHPQVVSFRLGKPQEGGTGVTIVELAA